MKQILARMLKIIFPNLTVEGVALFFHQLIFNSWSALGNVATNASLQFIGGANWESFNKWELLRSAVSQLLPVIIALLWPSPIQRFHSSAIAPQPTTVASNEENKDEEI